ALRAEGLRDRGALDAADGQAGSLASAGAPPPAPAMRRTPLLQDDERDHEDAQRGADGHDLEGVDERRGEHGGVAGSSSWTQPSQRRSPGPNFVARGASYGTHMDTRVCPCGEARP